MKSEEKQSNSRLILIACLVFVLVFNGVFLLSGRFSGGFQPMDDHEILAIPYRIKSSSLVLTLWGWMKEDFDLRFRPVYCIYRVLSSLLFCGNSQFAAIWTILLGNAFGLALIVLFSRYRYVPLLAALLPFLCCFGPQIESWQLIGCQENIALLAMVFVLWRIFRVVEKTTWQNEAILLCGFAIMTGCKESFIPIVPALLWWRCMLEANHVPDKRMREIILSGWPWKTAALVLVVMEIIFIKLAIPSHYTSDVGTSHSKLFYLGINCLYTLETGMGELLVLSLGFLAVCIKRNRTPWKQLVSIVILVCFGAGSQIVGYAFIHDRYMLPCIFFYAMGICEAIHSLPANSIIGVYSTKEERFFVKTTLVMIIISVFSLILTWNLKIANEKKLNEFLPISLYGIIGALCVLAILCSAWLSPLHKQKWRYLYPLICLYIAMRGNLECSYTKVTQFMHGVRDWDNAIAMLTKKDPSAILLVSDPRDGISFEGQVFMHSLYKFHNGIETKWVILGITNDEIKRRQKKNHWGFYHQGRALSDDLLSESDLNKGKWDVAFVLDRLHNGVVEKMMLEHGFKSYEYTNEEKTMAVLW